MTDDVSAGDPDNHAALSLLRPLLAIPAPSGREEALAAAVRAHLSDLGFRHETDGAGNVLVRLAGQDPRAPLVCLAAHMDEIGFVVTEIALDGRLRVAPSGGLHPWKLGEGPVTILGDVEPVPGILSFGSTHRPGAGDRVLQWDDVRVDTGLTPDQLSRRGIRPGALGVPAAERRGPVLLGDPADPLVGAWTFDDRLGVVTLIRLLGALHAQGLQPPQPLLVAFTVQEEIGGHGAKLVAHRERPEVFIAVDGCPVLPEMPLALDGRPGIWSKDRLITYDQALLRDLSRAALRAGTELQPAVYRAAASDASLVHASGGAPRVACLGQARENSHGFELLRLSVCDHLLNTLVAFVRDWSVAGAAPVQV